MKHYEFNIEIKEGNDEFWNGLKGSGCDEVKELIVDVLATIGFYDGDNCNIYLMEFSDNKKVQ